MKLLARFLYISMQLQLWDSICVGIDPHGAKSEESCFGICGNGKESITENEVNQNQSQGAPDQDEDEYVDDEQIRIINGWNAPPRPWMVLITVVNPDDPEDYDTCGGALLNKRYILTAGHCVCLEYTDRNPCTDGKVEYDAAEIIKVYIGLNNANFKEVLKKNKQDYQYLIEKEVKMSLSGLNSVGPICLPSPGEALDIYEEKGYVAGWGMTRNDACFTDNFGPERHAKCRFPFLYKGLEIDKCLNAETPSTSNKKCQQFKEVMGENKMPLKGSSIMIVYNRIRKTICFHHIPTKFGWCGTCIRGVKPFTYGYCPDNMNPPEDPKIITRVKPSKHWGFCSKLCEQQEYGPTQLQETSLTVLSDKDCAHFNSSTMLFKKGIEFCAGFKMQYPKMPIYKRYRNPDWKVDSKNLTGKYIFKFVTTKLNRLGAQEKHYKLGYYLGETDSCQGDSGGPFYIFKGSKAFLVGVVSRGGQCAGFNQPGIYSNLLHPETLQWVKENIADGHC